MTSAPIQGLTDAQSERTAQLALMIDDLAAANRRLEEEILLRQAAEESLRELSCELVNRIRQMDCLEAISELLQEPEFSEDLFLQKVITILPAAWQFPDIACARLILEDKQYATSNFQETLWRLSAPVIVDGGLCGALDVCYLREPVTDSPGPFLRGERTLIHSVAERIGKLIEQTRAEGRIKALKRLIELVLGATNTGLTIVDADFNVVYVDPATEKLRGACAGKKCHEHFCPDGGGCPTCHVAEALRTKKPMVREVADGADSQRVFQVTSTPFQDEQGRWLVAHVSADITQRKAAEEKREKMLLRQQGVSRLQRSLLGPGTLEEKLKSITEAVVNLFEADFCRIWVIRPGDLCQQGCIHAEVHEGPHVCRHRERCLHLVASSGRYTHIDGQVHRRVPFGCYKIGRVAADQDTKFLTNDAANDPRVHNRQWARELGLVSFAGYRIHVTGGETLGVLALFAARPLSDDEDAMLEGLSSTAARVIWQAALDEALRQSQHDLAQAQRLEAIGQLAAGIAHEINTPIQYIGDNLRFFREAFGTIADLFAKGQQFLEALKQEGGPAELIRNVESAVRHSDMEFLLDEIPKAIEQSIEGVERVSSIVRAMKEFSHPAGAEFKSVDLNRAIQNTLTISRNEWKYVADLVTDLDPELPPVQCLPNEINQVILNLVVNAAQAIAKAVEDGLRSRGTITLRSRREGDWARIDVEDTGTGIPEAIRPRIFDHFFTTKEVGKGTGQGLSIARAIVVKKHGGTITFQTEVGRGTVFTVRLPLTDKPRPVQPEPPKAFPSPEFVI